MPLPAAFLGYHLLNPFRNVELKTRWREDVAFSSAPDDPVCGDSKPILPPDPWLPLPQRQVFHPPTMIGLLGVTWGQTEGRNAVEMAALPCIPFRASIVLTWPSFR
jgi:hypothetical protein